jgi:hypothetical protein
MVEVPARLWHGAKRWPRLRTSSRFVFGCCETFGPGPSLRCPLVGVYLDFQLQPVARLLRPRDTALTVRFAGQMR